VTEVPRTTPTQSDTPDGACGLALVDGPLPVEAANAWAGRPDCGAVVTFTGTVRDHADGVEGVTHLEYEAYDEQVVPRLEAIEAEIRVRWPEVGRVAVLHRVGRVDLGEPAVVVAVSAPHRDAAFAAARFAIDTAKATLPIWKREHAEGVERWGSAARPVDTISRAG
jgi:molybdopterin synthase catalytic subunit